MNDYKQWYDEAIEASNECGFAGMSAAQVIQYQDGEIKRLKGIVDEVHSWIVCACIASAEDMMQSADHICEITAP